MVKFGNLWLYTLVSSVLTNNIIWCNLGESVGTRTCDIFSFLFDWSAHLEKYILLKSPLELVQWFQGYEQLKVLRTIENNRYSFLFLAISHNQCCRLLTDPARSQQKCEWLVGPNKSCNDIIIITFGEKNIWALVVNTNWEFP